MNPYPQTRSVLILDNVAIHHTEAMHKAVEGAGTLSRIAPLLKLLMQS